MHANTPGTLSCRVSWTRRPLVPSIFRLPCMCSFPLSRGLEGHSRHRCAVPFILAHTPYSMMVQAPGERLWCSSHCPRTGTVCADHVVSGPFLRCAQKAMRSRQHRTPGPHTSVRAALVRVMFITPSVLCGQCASRVISHACIFVLRLPVSVTR